MTEPNKALVIFSGGQDSTTCLFMARRYNPHGTYALTFGYGQKHECEIKAACQITALADVKEHELLMLPDGVLQSKSPLVNDLEEVGTYGSVAEMPGGTEPTFVEGRNMLFIALAFNRAAVLGCREIWMGVSQADYGGYPDCRQVFITKMQATGNESLGRKPEDSNYIRIMTPLINMNKEATVRLAMEIDKGGEANMFAALAASHTCYQGSRPPCGHCHACILRARGFAATGIADPLITQCKLEGMLASTYPDSGLVVQ